MPQCDSLERPLVCEYHKCHQERRRVPLRHPPSPHRLQDPRNRTVVVVGTWWRDLDSLPARLLSS